MKGFKNKMERLGKKEKILILEHRDKTRDQDQDLEVKLTKKNHKNQPIKT